MAKGLLLGAGFSFDLGMPLASEFSDTLFSFFTAEKMSHIINNLRGHKPYSNNRTLCDTTLSKFIEIYNEFLKSNKYGIVPPSENDIISAFTQNGTGTVIGYSLYNSLNLTTQVSQRIVVVSSALVGFTKTIRNITVYQLPLDYSEPVINMVNGLEVLQNFSNIQDINLSAFLVYTEKIAKTYDAISIQKILATGRYKKSTISFLREVLNFYHRENNLDIYLSALSEYKHPKMVDICIAAKQ